MLWHLLGTRDNCAVVGRSLHRSREFDVVSEVPWCVPISVRPLWGSGRDGTTHVGEHGTQGASGLLKVSDEISAENEWWAQRCPCFSLAAVSWQTFDTEAPWRFSTPTWCCNCQSRLTTQLSEALRQVQAVRNWWPFLCYMPVFQRLLFLLKIDLYGKK